MSYSPAEEMLQEARAKGELYKYFGGYPEYALQHPVADMPTDHGGMITPIQRIAGSDASIMDEVHAAWLRLVEDDVYGWFVVYYFPYIASLNKISGKDWLPANLLREIADKLRAKKATFSSLKRWHGENLENGCWGLVLSANATLHDKYNITVLPEEL